MSSYRHRVPELQAVASIGNLYFRHRTPFGVYIIIEEGGGVVPEVGQIDFSTVVIDDAHAGSVWCVSWGRGCQGGSLSVRSDLSLPLSLSLPLTFVFPKDLCRKKRNGDLDLQHYFRQEPSTRGLISPR